MTTLKHKVIVSKTLISSQSIDEISELYIYLNFVNKTIELYCNDEQKLKYNFLKVSKKHNIFKSDKDFWSRIIDINISDTENDPNNYQIIFDLKDIND